MIKVVLMLRSASTTIMFVTYLDVAGHFITGEFFRVKRPLFAF